MLMINYNINATNISFMTNDIIVTYHFLMNYLEHYQLCAKIATNRAQKLIIF